MARKKFKVKQIVLMLREAEVQLANGKISLRYAVALGFPRIAITAGARNTAG